MSTTIEVRHCYHVPQDSTANQTICKECGHPIKYIHAPGSPELGHWVEMDARHSDWTGDDFHAPGI
jgi:hypothetical protein